ncbi:hypothetical protein ACFO4U_04415 [Exiguobacterium profundum]|uniref:hypothetical protein n=1 Tax=Exiguobacterium profundum TaxID=307643 RepID=UPI002036D7D3|nr:MULTISPECIES: hypothetical protein [Exiguobacterium]MCT4796896.1 hypothetical protein [Exiguobacterium profundum]
MRARKTFGHWELDTEVSGHGWEIEGMRRDVRRTIEQDLHRPSNHKPGQGVQLSRANPNVQLYFIDPYASWQSGGNENANGLIHEFLPKGTNFAQVDDVKLAEALAKNQRAAEEMPRLANSTRGIQQ